MLKETRLWPLFNYKALDFGYWKPDFCRGSTSLFLHDYTGWCVPVSLGKFPTLGGGEQDQKDGTYGKYKQNKKKTPNETSLNPIQKMK